MPRTKTKHLSTRVDATMCRIYRRVSLEEQAERRNGMDAQMDTCVTYARKHGWTIPGETFADAGQSGTAPLHKRTGLLDAIASLQPGDVLLVAKRDRLARDADGTAIPMIEHMVRKRKAKIVSAAGEGSDGADPNDPSQWITRKVSDLFAAYEVITIRFRTRLALRARRKRDLITGAVPYGHVLRDDSKITVTDAKGKRNKYVDPILIKHEEEQQVLAIIHQLRREGRTLRAIAQHLTESQVPTKNGGRWHPFTVSKLLKGH